MRIAIFTNNYLPNPYGVTQSIESFRRQFERRGHTVYIFAPKWKGYADKNPNACPTENFSQKNFGRVFRYPSVDIKYKISFPLAIPYSFKISKILKNLKLDIIHSQHPNLLGGAAAKWAKRKKIPLVFTWHTLYDQYVHFAPLVPKKWAAEWIIKKAVDYANKADFVITPTESAKKIIKNWGVKNENIVAIPSGIDENNFINPDRSIIRKKYGISGDETLLFTVCRLTAEKNVEFLFRTVMRAMKLYEKSKFLIVSDGDLLDKLKLMAKENNLENRIFFAGIVAREKIKNYFAAGDIFVYASKSETQGMIVSEAMYMGLPVVAVDATGSKDLIENNINGFLVPENSPREISQGETPPGRGISQGEDKFAGAVTKLIKDSELRKRFGEKSAEIAREKYTDKVCAGRMLEIYNSLIKS